jgi:hypothetical protein
VLLISLPRLLGGHGALAFPSPARGEGTVLLHFPPPLAGEGRVGAFRPSRFRKVRGRIMPSWQRPDRKPHSLPFPESRPLWPGLSCQPLARMDK